jgi:hypothetical protein
MGLTFFALTLLTALLWLGGPLLEKIPLGHLPGDFSFRLGAVNFSLPLASILLCAIVIFILYKIYLKLSK